MSEKHPWVILFDIDGTLLTVNRTFNRPLIRGVLDELDINYPDMEKQAFSGRTDHDILTSFLENHNYDPKLYQKIKALYIKRIDEEIGSDHIIRHPYIDRAISFFDEMGAYIGLLTGNYPKAAQAKLRAADVKYDFRFGAFGEFDKDRNQLPMIALKEVSEKLNLDVNPSKFIIIGDTPRDIECAKYAGMKSIAVTTGRFTEKELSEYNPDMILPNLANPEEWFSKLTMV